MTSLEREKIHNYCRMTLFVKLALIVGMMTSHKREKAALNEDVEGALDAPIMPQ